MAHMKHVLCAFGLLFSTPAISSECMILLLTALLERNQSVSFSVSF